MHFLIEHIVNINIFLLFINSVFFLVSQSRKSSASKSRDDKSLPVDNFRRQESTRWMMPSEKQYQQNHRPLTEQNDNYRNSRLRTVSDQNELLMNRRQGTTIE
jgi:hypothetical protein